VIRILDPTVAAAHAEASLARRVDDLDGKVVGLLTNSKVNGDVLLDLVGGELGRRYRLRDVVTAAKPGASRVAEEALLERLARTCDVVITAIGD
jgi:hypothetical protein